MFSLMIDDHVTVGKLRLNLPDHDTVMKNLLVSQDRVNASVSDRMMFGNGSHVTTRRLLTKTAIQVRRSIRETSDLAICAKSFVALECKPRRSAVQTHELFGLQLIEPE